MAKNKSVPNHYVKFMLIEEDHLAFSKYLFSHDEKMKKTRRRNSIAYVILLVGLGAWVISKGYTEWIPVAFFIMVLFGFLTTLYSARQQYLSSALTIFRKKNSQAYTGEHILQVIPAGLKHSFFGSTLDFYWRDIFKVIETNKHGFIFLSPGSAIVVPKEKVTEGNFEAVFAAVRKQLEKMGK
ncbi:MAG: YcxB family protein [Anaerolineales bacterium]|nr:YcxB family protein [Anaerolineales bacterium]